jgi:hypothetical protein
MIVNFLLVLTVFISSIYTFRMHFEGLLIGDPFDTRLQIAQHEHWFRFFSSESKFRDTLFFYPFDKALGFTDAFFIPSMPYSLMRHLDMHPVNAWFYASFIFFLLGNLGWIFVAKKLFKNNIIKIFFVWTITTFPTLIILLERAPQILAFAWISWLFYLTLDILEKKQKNKKINSSALLVILLPFLMLTSWYPVFFYLMTLLTSILIYIIFNYKQVREKLTKFTFKPNLSENPSLILALLISLFILVVWAYVHIPLLGETSRSWSETIYYSSYLQQVLNQQYLNNGWYFLLVKNSQYMAFQQSNVALPILTIILTIVFLIISFWHNNKIILNYRTYVLLPAFLIFLVFLRITEDFSLYKIFWDNIPGLQSIRFPYRYLIVFGFVLIIFIFLSLDNLIVKFQKTTIKYWALILLMMFLSLDNLKPPFAIWSKDDYLIKELEQQVDQIREECDFFILDKPGGWWDDQISGISLSVLSGVPTSNGYSGGFPRGYPVKDWNYDGDISEILEWSKFNTSEDLGCLISTSHEVIKANPQEPKYFFTQDFHPRKPTQVQFAGDGQNQTKVISYLIFQKGLIQSKLILKQKLQNV